MEYERELYQEYEDFIVYDIYKIKNNGDSKIKKFLYRTTEDKLKTKYTKLAHGWKDNLTLK